eukprot:10008869-Lingulodinium_polyedra.AAC.1
MSFLYLKFRGVFPDARICTLCHCPLRVVPASGQGNYPVVFLGRSDCAKCGMERTDRDAGSRRGRIVSIGCDSFVSASKIVFDSCFLNASGLRRLRLLSSEAVCFLRESLL